MQARTLLAVVGAATVLCAGTANAQTTWQAHGGSDSGNWSDTNHWTAGVPDASDAVTLPALSGVYTVTMDVATGHANNLIMNANAKVDIATAKVLEINADGTNNSTIDGIIQLSVSGSVLYVRDNNHTFSGSGSVDMQHDTARIDIALSKVFTSEILIQGQGQIKGLTSGGNRGAFVNGSSGIVEANAQNGVLELMSDTGLSGAGEWKVTLCAVDIFDVGSTLRFSRAPTATLTGVFTITAGLLDLDVNVTTDKDLVYDAGKIDVASGATFTFGDGSGADSSGTCGTQPSSTLSNEVFAGCSC